MKDGYKWWCKACKTSKTLRAGSFFEKSKIPLRTWILLIHLWAYQLPVCKVAQLVEVNKEMAINVFQWLREVCSTKLVNTSTATRNEDHRGGIGRRPTTVSANASSDLAG